MENLVHQLKGIIFTASNPDETRPQENTSPD